METAESRHSLVSYSWELGGGKEKDGCPSCYAWGLTGKVSGGEAVVPPSSLGFSQVQCWVHSKEEILSELLMFVVAGVLGINWHTYPYLFIQRRESDLQR